MSDTKTTTHWRPRFSLRALFVLVLVSALYMALGPATRKGKIDVIEFSVRRNGRMMNSMTYFAPILLVCTERVVDRHKAVIANSTGSAGEPRPPNGTVMKFPSRRKSTHTYYFWFFGYVAKLPVSVDRDYQVIDPKTNQWINE